MPGRRSSLCGLTALQPPSAGYEVTSIRVPSGIAMTAS